jgi:hypothetical protein
MKKVLKVLIEKYKEKECTKCKNLRPIVDFHENKSNKNGLASHCKFCYNEHKRIKYAENPELEKNRKKIFYENNPDYTKTYNITNWKYIQSQNKTYREENIESIKIQKKSTYEQNKESIIKKVVEYERKRYKVDQLYKLKKVIRQSITGSIKKQGYLKQNKTAEILGCTFEEFKTHIENKFLPWMNWGNHGLYNGELNYGWDLDHIVPISSALTEGELIKLNHYTNFQPLCSKVNRNIKREKLNFT